MTLTRAQLIARAAQRIGGRSGDISSGTATRAVLSGLINTTGDDSEFEGDRLFMLNAASEADKERFIDVWEDAVGTAHFATRSDTDYTSETYIVAPREDYSLAEYRNALTVAMRETRRTYRQVIPVAQNQYIVPIADLTWLNGAADIDAIWASNSPNLLHNEDFSLWQNGDAAAPDAWTLAGDGAVIARTTDGIRSGYAATLTSVGTAVTLSQSIRLPLLEYLLRSVSATLPTFTAGAWVTCDTASVARVGISNGTTTTYSSYHTGSGEPQWLEVTYASVATDEEITIVLAANTTGDAIWHTAALVTDDLPDALKDSGSAAYDEYRVTAQARNAGGHPIIELTDRVDGQLILYTRRTFPVLTADSDEIDDQYARALEAGLLCKLLEVVKPNQDRTRLDRILVEQRRIWTRLTDNFIDMPVPDPPVQYVVTGA